MLDRVLVLIIAVTALVVSLVAFNVVNDIETGASQEYVDKEIASVVDTMEALTQWINTLDINVYRLEETLEEVASNIE